MASVYKRGKKWYLQFRHEGKLYREAGGDTKSAAQTLLGARLKELKENAERFKLGVPKACRITLDDLAPRFMEWSRAHKRSSTSRSHALSLKYLLPVFGTMVLTDITKARVEAYQRDRLAATNRHGKPMSPSSINREVACLRKMISFAVEQGDLEKNHLLRVKMLRESPARKPVLESYDEEKIITLCQPWLASLVRLCLGSGIRQGEALALRWRDIDFEASSVAITDSKTGDSRTAAVHPNVLQELKARRGLPDGYVVVMADGNRPKPMSVSRGFKRAATKAGRPDLRFHDLRHVFAQRLLEAGASLPELAAQLGHKTLDMVQRYTNPNRQRLRALVASIPTN